MIRTDKKRRKEKNVCFGGTKKHHRPEWLGADKSSGGSRHETKKVKKRRFPKKEKGLGEEAKGILRPEKRNGCSVENHGLKVAGIRTTIARVKNRLTVLKENKRGLHCPLSRREWRGKLHIPG